jgi:hypothetical protein
MDSKLIRYLYQSKNKILEKEKIFEDYSWNLLRNSWCSAILLRPVLFFCAKSQYRFLKAGF